MKKRKNNNDINKKSTFFFAKFSGLAFEMLGIIFLGVFVGQKLDQWKPNDISLFTVIFSLLGVFISLYVVLKEFIKK